MALILATQIISVIQGIIFAVIIHPGTALGGEVPESKATANYADIFADLLRLEFALKTLKRGGGGVKISG